MTARVVLCPYCQKPAELCTSNALPWIPAEKRAGNYWVCHACQAYVGTHQPNAKFGHAGDEPLGTLAKKSLRQKRQQVHRVMDPIWRELRWNRQKLYDWLAARMGISAEECHVGMFDMDACERALALLEQLATFASQNRKDVHGTDSGRP